MEKKLLKYLPFHFLISLVVGIYLQFNYIIYKFSFKNLVFSFLIILFLLLIFHLTKRKLLFGFTSTACFALLGISSVFLNDNRNFDNYYNIQYQETSNAVFTVTKVLKPGNYYNKYEVDVSQIDSIKTIGKVLLNIQKDSFSNPLQVDDKIFLKPVFKDLIDPLNPHQFSYKDYLAKQGIFNQVFVDDNQYKIIGKKHFSLLGLSANFRSVIQKSLLKHNFKKDEYAVINALLLGQRQDISKDLLQDYSRAGAIHILAVSGLHVGIILLLLNQLFQRFNTTIRGAIFKTLLIILLLWMFAFIAGLSASVVRAVTMFTFVAVGQTFKRKRIVEHSLITSMFFLLLVKPMFLFDVGFQLSYLAVFGIVWFQPLHYNLWQPKLNFVDKGWQLFTVSLSAQAGILPISLFYFHQFPSLFMVSNMVIIPFLGMILLGGILVIILSLLNILPEIIAKFYGYVIHYMNSFVSWISHQEDFLFRNISINIWQMLFWYLMIFLFLRFFIKKTSKSFIFALIAIVSVQFSYFFESYQKSKKEEFIVFHKSRKSVLGVRNGEDFTVYSDVDSIRLNNEKLLTSYVVGENIQANIKSKTPNIFHFKNDKILRIDSLGIYKIDRIKSPIILIQYSPKINLTRLISDLKPLQIIADGTNYKSYINRWEATCKKEKTPFHYTGQNGAYILKE